MNIREIISDDLDKLLGLYTNLHDDDTIPEPHVILEETLRFYESAGFDRHAKQAFVIRRA